MPSPLLSQLLYVSEARIDPCGPEPRRIIDVATERNAAAGVTGLLCFSGDHFAQLLEGPAAGVEGLMASIRVDERHRMLHEWPLEPAPAGRRFPGWSMGYVYDTRLEALIAALAGQPARQLSLSEVAAVLFADLDQYQARQP